MNRADAGRGLRKMMLTTSPDSFGVTPSKDFPRVYGILMDWPVGENTATVFSASDGAASLYTTSTFGIIGGEGHQSIREAAIRFVRAADQFYEASSPTKEFPYPDKEHVRFYFLTFEGVRVLETKLVSVENRTEPYSKLFALGQSVLTELRITTEKAK
jgi:hypothetical protein